jgi:hypothetical protein
MNALREIALLVLSFALGWFIAEAERAWRRRK